MLQVSLVLSYKEDSFSMPPTPSHLLTFTPHSHHTCLRLHTLHTPSHLAHTQYRDYAIANLPRAGTVRKYLSHTYTHTHTCDHMHTSTITKVCIHITSCTPMCTSTAQRAPSSYHSSQPCRTRLPTHGQKKKAVW